MEFLRKYASTLLVILVVFSLFLPAVSLAQKDCLPDSGKICNPISQNDITSLLEAIVVGVIRLGLPVIVLAIIYCGFLFVKARGNEEELTKAKSALLWTLIGAAVLMGAMGLATLIDVTVKAL